MRRYVPRTRPHLVVVRAGGEVEVLGVVAALAADDGLDQRVVAAGASMRAASRNGFS